MVIKRRKGERLCKILWTYSVNRKTNLSIRVTHDYSALKPMTSLYRFEQNKIEDIWTWASGRQFLIKLDFIKAFHSVEIDELDYPFYGFIGRACLRNFNTFRNITPCSSAILRNEKKCRLVSNFTAFKDCYT
eukprot:GHVP01043964.1.p1 GENE.GHVP01043964.1~~GHVP01043964.1.p1  ORF type:complete len:132 (-),score=10.63 GHVP01043964.1:81-476(-)